MASANTDLYSQFSLDVFNVFFHETQGLTLVRVNYAPSPPPQNILGGIQFLVFLVGQLNLMQTLMLGG